MQMQRPCRTLNSLLNSSTGALQSHTSNESLSNNFANYFTEKFSKIRSELDHCVLNVNNSTSLVKCMCLYQLTTQM